MHKVAGEEDNKQNKESPSFQNPRSDGPAKDVVDEDQ